MQLAHQFQGQTVKGQGYRVGGITLQPHCLLIVIIIYHHF